MLAVHVWQPGPRRARGVWELGPKAFDLLVAGRDRDSLARWLAVHVGEPGSSECDLPVAGRDRDSLAPLPCSARVGSLGRRPATCLCGSCCWTVDLTCQVEAKPEPRAYGDGALHSGQLPFA